MRDTVQMREPPLVSVVVFVRNAANTISKALESVTAADQPPVELLVMDGGSTDGTLDVIRQFEPKIAYWRSFQDGGAVHALNEGVRRATGDIICLLPADDWLEPGALQIVCEQFRGDPQLEVLSCGTRVVRLDQRGLLLVEADFTDPRVLEFSMANIVRYPLTTARFVLRRLYNELGEYDSSLRIANDLDFLVRILLRRPHARVVPQLVYNYRSHAGSRVLGADPGGRMELMREFVRVAERHLPDARLSLLERRALRGLHGRSSAHLAWALLRHGQFGQASTVLARAVRLNWLFPLLLPVWYARKPRRGGGPTA